MEVYRCPKSTPVVISGGLVLMKRRYIEWK